MAFLVSDPWVELIRDVSQSGCQNPGALPPRDLRSVFASAILFDAPSVYTGTMRKSHPLNEAILSVLAKRCGKVFPPLARPLLPIGEMCQFALLTSIGGENLLPFHRFPSLWCPEGAYREKEALWSIALLMRSFGKYLPIPPNPDPYFLALAKLAPEWKGESEPLARLYQGSGIEMALTRGGEGVPLGAIRAGGVEIPAMGPHTYPLNEPGGFGVRRTCPDDRWGAASAMPEVWFEAAPDLGRGILETRFYGLRPERPLAFAFYARADQAEINGGAIKPKSLNRYVGGAKKIVLERGETRLAISCEPCARMEVIPLAGEGCFWNAEFLIAFEISQIEGRGMFKFEIV